MLSYIYQRYLSETKSFKEDIKNCNHNSSPTILEIREIQTISFAVYKILNLATMLQLGTAPPQKNAA